MNVLLWVVYPYLAMVALVGGLIWRYRYDKFGLTTRSSQLYETTVLRWGSPLFHFGILMVLIGHVGGLLIPKTWTEAVGITEHAYHLMAVFIGTVAGFCTLIGMAILIARRRLTGPVFAATTKNDKAMYLVLAAVMVLGLWTTVRANATGPGYDYRETISPWFRSLFYLPPDPDVMAAVPFGFQLHVLAAFALFAFWPFTRLVHAFSAPRRLSHPPLHPSTAAATPARGIGPPDLAGKAHRPCPPVTVAPAAATDRTGAGHRHAGMHAPPPTTAATPSEEHDGQIQSRGRAVRVRWRTAAAANGRGRRDPARKTVERRGR